MPRGSTGGAAAVALSLLLAAASAAAQTPSPDGVPSPAPSDVSSGPEAATVRCAAWDPAAAGIVAQPSALHTREAAISGRVAAAAAAVETECSYPRTAISALDLAPSTQRLFDLVGVTEAFRAQDAANDGIKLDGSAIGVTPDPATDLDAVLGAPFTLTKAGARKLIAGLGKASDAFGDAFDVTALMPLDQILRAGDHQLLFLDTAGDPTTVPTTTRIYQVGFESRTPEAAVIPTIPITTPLTGVRKLATFGRFVSGSTETDGTGLSDFGLPKVGPDGTTQYYNVPPRFLAITTPDGVAMIIPASTDPLGFRPMAYDAAADVWDIGHAPDGPMAFIPADGSAPGLFDFLLQDLANEPVTMPKVTRGGNTLTDQTFPSHLRLIGRSAAFADPAAPPTLELGVEVDGRRWRYPELPAEPLAGSDAVFSYTYGIPQVGTYTIDRATFDEAGLSPSTSRGQLREMTRALGAKRFAVDATPGVMDAALARQFLAELVADQRMSAETAATLGAELFPPGG